MSRQIWRIKLLGELEVEREDGVVVRPLGGMVLALLALGQRVPHPLRPSEAMMVRREEIRAQLWPDRTPASAHNAFRLALHKLRKILNVDQEPVLIEDAARTRIGLRSDAVITDRVEFQQYLQRARSASDPVQIRSLLSKAVALYRGDLLPKFGADPFIAARAELRGAYLEALSQLVALHRQASEWVEVVHFARALLEKDTTDEETILALLTALEAMGREREARNEYRRFAARLQEEGMLPGAEFQRWQQRLNLRPQPVVPSLWPLQPAATPGTATALPAHPSEPVPHVPSNLPRFFGRERELRQLEAWLHPCSIHEVKSANRLVTLTGIGGIGKTSLAIAAIRQLMEAQPALAGNIWFLPLDTVREVERLLPTIAALLGLPPASDVELQVVTFLQGRPTLLVLDNFEQLLVTSPIGSKMESQMRSQMESPGETQMGSQIVERLLVQLPHLHCLVTSRQRLGLTGERVLPVRPLPTPTREAIQSGAGIQTAALALFSDRARTVRQDFRIDASNLGILIRLCRRLEGIPLALVLAASWVRVLTPAEMVDQLKDRFALLKSRGNQEVETVRHRSLAIALDWSYALLSEELRAVFAQLSVFRGGWTLEAATAVASSVTPTFESLDMLIERSLMIATETNQGMRYWMLESLREYAELKLKERGEYETAQERHRAFFLQLAETASPHLRASQQHEWANRMEREHANLRHALDSATDLKSKEEALRIAIAIVPFWDVRGYLAEGQERLQRIRTSFPHDPSLYLQALLGEATLAYRQSVYAHSLACYEESLTLANKLQDQLGIAEALRGIGNVRHRENRIEEAHDFHQRSLSIFRQLGDRRGIAATVNALALATRRLGDLDMARQQHLEALALFREIGALWNESIVLSNLGILESWASGRETNGNLQSRERLLAFHYLQESLTIAQRLESKPSIASALLHITWLHFYGHDYAAMHGCLREMLPLMLSLQQYVPLGESFILAALRSYGMGRQDEKGAVALRIASDLYKRSGVSMPDFLQARYTELDRRRADPNLAGAIARAWEIGASMSVSDAIAFMLDDERGI